MTKATMLVPVLLSIAGVVPVVAPAAEPVGVTAVFDYGVVRAGEVLAPCVRLENRSSHEVRVQIVRPPCNCTPFDVTIAPHEQVVRPLGAVDTRDYRGPTSKTYFLLLTPPGDVAAELLATCPDVGSGEERPSTTAD